MNARLPTSVEEWKNYWEKANKKATRWQSASKMPLDAFLALRIAWTIRKQDVGDRFSLLKQHPNHGLASSALREHLGWQRYLEDVKLNSDRPTPGSMALAFDSQLELYELSLNMKSNALALVDDDDSIVPLSDTTPVTPDRQPGSYTGGPHAPPYHEADPTKAKDEQIINRVVVNILQGMIMDYAKQTRWSMVRRIFRFGNVYEARTDGYLRFSQADACHALLECKAANRMDAAAIAVRMQEGAQMAAWILAEPSDTLDIAQRQHDTSDPKTKTKKTWLTSNVSRTLLISGDNQQLFLNIAEFTDDYVAFLKFLASIAGDRRKTAKIMSQIEDDAFMTMYEYGPYNINNAQQMAESGDYVFAHAMDVDGTEFLTNAPSGKGKAPAWNDPNLYTDSPAPGAGHDESHQAEGSPESSSSGSNVPSEPGSDPFRANPATKQQSTEQLNIRESTDPSNYTLPFRTSLPHQKSNERVSASSTRGIVNPQASSGTASTLSDQRTAADPLERMDLAIEESPSKTGSNTDRSDLFRPRKHDLSSHDSHDDGAASERPLTQLVQPHEAQSRPHSTLPRQAQVQSGDRIRPGEDPRGPSLTRNDTSNPSGGRGEVRPSSDLMSVSRLPSRQAERQDHGGPMPLVSLPQPPPYTIPRPPQISPTQQLERAIIGRPSQQTVQPLPGPSSGQAGQPSGNTSAKAPDTGSGHHTRSRQKQHERTVSGAQEGQASSSRDTGRSRASDLSREHANAEGDKSEEQTLNLKNMFGIRGKAKK